MKLMVIIINEEYKDCIVQKMKANDFQIKDMYLDTQCPNKSILFIALQDYQLCLAKSILQEYFQKVCKENDDLLKRDFTSLDDLLKSKITVLINYEEMTFQ